MEEKKSKCVACGVEINEENKFEHDSNVCFNCGVAFNSIFDKEEETED